MRLPALLGPCHDPDMPSPDAFAAPVFVLTTFRSGSTLLRFLIDSHPEFACPPESRVAAACGHLALTWSSLETAGSGRARQRDDPLEVSDQAAKAIRSAVSEAMGTYLRRRGKTRWCDKSFDSYEYAELIARIWPEAKFVILTRHCLDVIDSVIEVNPWSLADISLGGYAARYPGNSVAAVADYWLTCTQANLEFAGRHQQRCHLLRYEDLVAEPEDRMAELFAFLGVRQVPGIAQDCFRLPHEREGPGDHKIWLTSSIRRDQVGRGQRVPASLLPDALAVRLTAVLGTLGYPAQAPGRLTEPPEPAAGSGHELVAKALARRVAQAPDPERIAARWPAVIGTSIVLCVDDAGTTHEAVSWTFDGPGGSGPGGSGPAPGPAVTAPARLCGSEATWLALLDGRSDIVTDIARGKLRFARDGRRPPAALLHATAALLGLASVIPLTRTPPA